MHEIVRRNWAAYRDNLKLMRVPIEGGVQILAFQRNCKHPEWVAKQGTNPLSRKRIEAERRALEWLEPWHSRLRVPKLLDYMEAENETWLVRTGVAGQPIPFYLGAGREIPAALFTAAEWLNAFQELVPSPAAIDLRLLADQWFREAEERADEWSAPLWNQVRAMPMPGTAASCIHGDYWLGNLLFDDEHIGVVDWNGFQAGTPLDDLLTLLTTTPRVERGQALSWERSFLLTFFTSSPVQELLVSWARRRGLSPHESRFCFYLLLARRLRWELGYNLQTRSEKEREQAKNNWRPILDWLGAHDYPDPFLRPASAA